MEDQYYDTYDDQRGVRWVVSRGWTQLVASVADDSRRVYAPSAGGLYVELANRSDQDAADALGKLHDKIDEYAADHEVNVMDADASPKTGSGWALLLLVAVLAVID